MCQPKFNNERYRVLQRIKSVSQKPFKKLLKPTHTHTQARSYNYALANCINKVTNTNQTNYVNQIKIIILHSNTGTHIARQNSIIRNTQSANLNHNLNSTGRNISNPVSNKLHNTIGITQPRLAAESYYPGPNHLQTTTYTKEILKINPQNKFQLQANTSNPSSRKTKEPNTLPRLYNVNKQINTVSASTPTQVYNTRPYKIKPSLKTPQHYYNYTQPSETTIIQRPTFLSLNPKDYKLTTQLSTFVNPQQLNLQTTPQNAQPTCINKELTSPTQYQSDQMLIAQSLKVTLHNRAKLLSTLSNVSPNQALYLHHAKTIHNQQHRFHVRIQPYLAHYSTTNAHGHPPIVIHRLNPSARLHHSHQTHLGTLQPTYTALHQQLFKHNHKRYPQQIIYCPKQVKILTHKRILCKPLIAQSTHNRHVTQLLLMASRSAPHNTQNRFTHVATHATHPTNRKTHCKLYMETQRYQSTSQNASCLHTTIVNNTHCGTKQAKHNKQIHNLTHNKSIPTRNVSALETPNPAVNPSHINQVLTRQTSSSQHTRQLQVCKRKHLNSTYRVPGPSKTHVHRNIKQQPSKQHLLQSTIQRYNNTNTLSMLHINVKSTTNHKSTCTLTGSNLNELYTQIQKDHMYYTNTPTSTPIADTPPNRTLSLYHFPPYPKQTDHNNLSIHNTHVSKLSKSLARKAIPPKVTTTQSAHTNSNTNSNSNTAQTNIKSHNTSNSRPTILIPRRSSEMKLRNKSNCIHYISNLTDPVNPLTAISSNHAQLLTSYNNNVKQNQTLQTRNIYNEAVNKHHTCATHQSVTPIPYLHFLSHKPVPKPPKPVYTPTSRHSSGYVSKHYKPATPQNLHFHKLPPTTYNQHVQSPDIPKLTLAIKLMHKPHRNNKTTTPCTQNKYSNENQPCGAPMQQTHKIKPTNRYVHKHLLTIPSHRSCHMFVQLHCKNPYATLPQSNIQTTTSHTHAYETPTVDATNFNQTRNFEYSLQTTCSCKPKILHLGIQPVTHKTQYPARAQPILQATPSSTQPTPRSKVTTNLPPQPAKPNLSIEPHNPQNHSLVAHLTRLHPACNNPNTPNYGNLPQNPEIVATSTPTAKQNQSSKIWSAKLQYPANQNTATVRDTRGNLSTLHIYNPQPCSQPPNPQSTSVIHPMQQDCHKPRPKTNNPAKTNQWRFINHIHLPQPAFPYPGRCCHAYTHLTTIRMRHPTTPTKTKNSKIRSAKLQYPAIQNTTPVSETPTYEPPRPACLNLQSCSQHQTYNLQLQTRCHKVSINPPQSRKPNVQIEPSTIHHLNTLSHFTFHLFTLPYNNPHAAPLLQNTRQLYILSKIPEISGHQHNFMSNKIKTPNTVYKTIVYCKPKYYTPGNSRVGLSTYIFTNPTRSRQLKPLAYKLSSPAQQAILLWQPPMRTSPSQPRPLVVNTSKAQIPIRNKHAHTYATSHHQSATQTYLQSTINHTCHQQPPCVSPYKSTLRLGNNQNQLTTHNQNPQLALNSHSNAIQAITKQLAVSKQSNIKKSTPVKVTQLLHTLFKHSKPTTCIMTYYMLHAKPTCPIMQQSHHNIYH
eukprot:gene3325-2307_t